MWTQKGDTPLHVAVDHHDEATVDKLLEVEGIDKIKLVTMQNKVCLVSVTQGGGTCMHGDPQLNAHCMYMTYFELIPQNPIKGFSY